MCLLMLGSHAIWLICPIHLWLVVSPFVNPLIIDVITRWVLEFYGINLWFVRVHTWKFKSIIHAWVFTYLHDQLKLGVCSFFFFFSFCLFLLISFDVCRGRFYDKGRKCENGPNLPLGSLEVFIVENQTQNSKCIMNKRLMVLWQERIKMLITKV